MRYDDEEDAYDAIAAGGVRGIYFLCQVGIGLMAVAAFVGCVSGVVRLFVKN